jgi:CBS domain-containing protein
MYECYRSGITNGRESYGGLWILSENLLYVSTWLVAGFILWFFYQPAGLPVFTVAWALLVVVVQVLLKKHNCSGCWYFNKRCHLGWGKLSALMFKADSGNMKTGMVLSLFYIIPPPVIFISAVVVGLAGGRGLYFWAAVALYVFLNLTAFPVRIKSCRACVMRSVCPGSAAKPKTVLLDGKAHVRGVFTAGDLRRALLKGRRLGSPVSRVMNTSPVTALKGTPEAELDVLARARRLGQSPIVLVDEKGVFADVFVPRPVLPSRFTREIAAISINAKTDVRGAMRVIDRTGLSIALVVDKKGKLLGLVTDHDIRKAVIKGASLDEPVSSIMNTRPIVGRVGMSADEIIRLNPTKQSIKIPLLDEKDRLRDLVTFYKDDRSVTQLLSVQDIKTTRGRKLKRILVTGGAGYLGCVFVRRLLARGYKVRVLDVLTFGRRSLRKFKRKPSFELIKGDVRHIEDITAAIQDTDAVIHLAGIVGDPACALDPLSTVEQNYLSTVALAQVARHHQVNRFIFASSCSVYGVSGKPAVRPRGEPACRKGVLRRRVYNLRRLAVAAVRARRRRGRGVHQGARGAAQQGARENFQRGHRPAEHPARRARQDGRKGRPEEPHDHRPGRRGQARLQRVVRPHPEDARLHGPPLGGPRHTRGRWNAEGRQHKELQAQTVFQLPVPRGGCGKRIIKKQHEKK